MGIRADEPDQMAMAQLLQDLDLEPDALFRLFMA